MGKVSSRAVLFDMDGVIVHSEPLHVAAFQAALLPYGYDLSEVQYKQFFAGKTDEAGFRQYFDFIGETIELPVIMDKKAKVYLELAADQLIAYPGVVACIGDLAKRGTPLALVTGSLRAEAEIVLKTFGLTDFFTAVIAAEDIAQSKPSPEGYLQGATALGVEPINCIVIEDAPSGVQAANAAGMCCIAVMTTHSEEELQHARLTVKQLTVSCIAQYL